MGASYSQIQEEMRDFNVWLDNIERRVQFIRKEDLKVRTGGGFIIFDVMCQDKWWIYYICYMCEDFVLFDLKVMMGGGFIFFGVL